MGVLMMCAKHIRESIGECVRGCCNNNLFEDTLTLDDVNEEII